MSSDSRWQLHPYFPALMLWMFWKRTTSACREDGLSCENFEKRCDKGTKDDKSNKIDLDGDYRILNQDLNGSDLNGFRIFSARSTLCAECHSSPRTTGSVSVLSLLSEGMPIACLLGHAWGGWSRSSLTSGFARTKGSSWRAQICSDRRLLSRSFVNPRPAVLQGCGLATG